MLTLHYHSLEGVFKLHGSLAIHGSLGSLVSVVPMLT